MAKIIPEQVEHQCNLLQRDYRYIRRAINEADPDAYTKSILNRLGHTVDDTCKMLRELQKQLAEKDKK